MACSPKALCRCGLCLIQLPLLPYGAGASCPQFEGMVFYPGRDWPQFNTGNNASSLADLQAAYRECAASETCVGFNTWRQLKWSAPVSVNEDITTAPAFKPGWINEGSAMLNATACDGVYAKATFNKGAVVRECCSCAAPFLPALQ